MLRAAAAAALDGELMPTLYTLDQLMELAGLATAIACQNTFPHPTYNTCAVLCGHGNNGGDGLVAARHLRSLGYKPSVFIARPSQDPHYLRLQAQLQALGIPSSPLDPSTLKLEDYSFGVDALLGFSARLPLRPPYDKVVTLLASSPLPLLSVDVPTGWGCDDDFQPPGTFFPRALVSLTVPKPCALAYETLAAVKGGRHYLGLQGIVPTALAIKYGLSPDPNDSPQVGGGVLRLMAKEPVL